MKNITRITLLGLLALAAFAQQNTLVETTLSAAITNVSATCFQVTAATGITAGSFSAGTAGSILYIQDIAQTVGESVRVTSVSSTTICGNRGANGTRAVTHASGAKVWIATAANWFSSVDPVGSCTLANTYVTPYINIANGKEWVCSAITLTWVPNGDYVFFVPGNSCAGAATNGSTVTNSYIAIGASYVSVLNSSLAAAGTNTITCNIMLPSRVTATRGAVLKDIVIAVGSKTTAPTSIGTATLGTITMPTPVATTQTASTVTPVTIGGTVTQLGPTTTVGTVTTDGAFLTFKYTFSTAVPMSTDLQMLQFNVPYVQSAAAVTVIEVPGLWIHYTAPAQ